MIQNHFVIIFQKSILLQEQTRKICQAFSIEHKINKTMQKYFYIIQSQACNIKIFVVSSGMCSTPELAKYFTLLQIVKQSHSVCSYLFALIKCYYVIPILRSLRQIISCINTFKFEFLVVIHLYFKMSQRMKQF